MNQVRCHAIVLIDEDTLKSACICSYCATLVQHLNACMNKSVLWNRVKQQGLEKLRLKINKQRKCQVLYGSNETVLDWILRTHTESTLDSILQQDCGVGGKMSHSDLSKFSDTDSDLSKISDSDVIT